jgi:hypothetical protein
VRDANTRDEPFERQLCASARKSRQYRQSNYSAIGIISAVPPEAIAQQTAGRQ